MKPQRKYSTLYGYLLLGALIFFHLYLAGRFYMLDEIKLNDFYFWQATGNAEKN